MGENSERAYLEVRLTQNLSSMERGDMLQISGLWAPPSEQPSPSLEGILILVGSKSFPQLLLVLVLEKSSFGVIF